MGKEVRKEVGTEEGKEVMMWGRRGGRSWGGRR